jgi:tetratricopeptide (TPR) repeat protein
MRLFMLLLVIPVACASQSVQEGPPNWRGITSEFNYDLRGESPRRQLQLLEEFFAEYPDCPELRMYLDRMVRLAFEIEEVDRAESLLLSLLEDSDSEERREIIRFDLLGIYARTGEEDRFEAVADALAASPDIQAWDHRDIAELAYEGGFWPRVLEHVEPAFESPMYQVDEVRIHSSRPGAEVSHRRQIQREIATLMAWKGAALIAQERPEEALSVLTEARTTSPPNLLGLSAVPYNRHFADAHLALGQVEDAIRYLAIEGLMGNDAGTMEDLREVYRRWKGSDDDFNRWSVYTRRDLGQQVPDFSLPDFSGAEHSFSDLQGQVVIVIFWGYG